MSDKAFDAVTIGGGTKALFLAMYLAKYGGMSVGMFERRHEIGGCLCTEETAAGSSVAIPTPIPSCPGIMPLYGAISLVAQTRIINKKICGS